MLVYQMMFDRDVVAQEAAMTELGEVRTLEASQAIAVRDGGGLRCEREKRGGGVLRCVRTRGGGGGGDL